MAPIYNHNVGVQVRADHNGAWDSGIPGDTLKSNVPTKGRRYRSTKHLSLKQTRGIIEAAQHAMRIGLAFNRHVTIRLERMGVADSNAVLAIGRYLTRFRDWLRKQGCKTAYAWVRESGHVIGSHVHILLHLPAGVTLNGHLSRRWIQDISGRAYKAGTICTKRISRSAYDENLSVVVGYLCKGASPDVAALLGLDRRKAGGAIIGKRAGWSENIGSLARRRWRLAEARRRVAVPAPADIGGDFARDRVCEATQQHGQCIDTA